MSQPKTQSYSNHVRIDPFTVFNYVASLLLVVVTLAGLVLDERIVLFCIPALAVMLLLTNMKARLFALTVQDRIIRLEMRLRLEQVLPEDLRGRTNELTLGQLIALRFASDEELSSLVRQVLEGKLSDPKAIKQAIEGWQGDFLRV